MSLQYEPSSEPLSIFTKLLFLNREKKPNGTTLSLKILRLWPHSALRLFWRWHARSGVQFRRLFSRSPHTGYYPHPSFGFWCRRVVRNVGWKDGLFLYAPAWPGASRVTREISGYVLQFDTSFRIYFENCQISDSIIFRSVSMRSLFADGHFLSWHSRCVVQSSQLQ